MWQPLFVCSESGNLELRTPSGRYQVRSISFIHPHIIVTHPNMWNCHDGDNFRATRPFSLDTSTHLTLSSHNDYLFFNCSKQNIIAEPKPIFRGRFPERCDSFCDSSSYLCRHLPGCATALGSSSSFCSYHPKATESLRLMLKYCTGIYWRNDEANSPYKQVPEYGIRVDFDIPVTNHCLRCQDMRKGGGTCGFDVQCQNFLCLCGQKNVTTFCNDEAFPRHSNARVIAGTVTLTGVSAAGAIGIGAGVWYRNKVRTKAPVACGVQSNENRLF